MNVKKITKWLKENSLVALDGNDLPLIEDFINEKCIIIVPEEYYSLASISMGTSHIDETK